MYPCLRLSIKIQRGIVATWWLWVCWGHSKVFCTKSRVCVSVSVCLCALSSCDGTAMLFWLNASHFMPWLDCSRYSFCTSNRAEIMCVFMCMSAGVSACESFCDCVSKCVLWGKMQDDSKGEERGNRCGGILKAYGETHTHTHTFFLSPLACCAAVTDWIHTISLCLCLSVCVLPVHFCSIVFPTTTSVYA